MKQDFAALLWPALVGVLAAAIILDKWVLERDDNTLGSAQSSYRGGISRHAFGSQHLHRQAG